MKNIHQICIISHEYVYYFKDLLKISLCTRKWTLAYDQCAWHESLNYKTCKLQLICWCDPKELKFTPFECRDGHEFLCVTMVDIIQLIARTSMIGIGGYLIPYATYVRVGQYICNGHSLTSYWLLVGLKMDFKGGTSHLLLNAIYKHIQCLFFFHATNNECSCPNDTSSTIYVVVVHGQYLQYAVFKAIPPRLLLLMGFFTFLKIARKLT